jgi:hypothetical protein
LEGQKFLQKEGGKVKKIFIMVAIAVVTVCIGVYISAHHRSGLDSLLKQKAQEISESIDNLTFSAESMGSDGIVEAEEMGWLGFHWVCVQMVITNAEWECEDHYNIDSVDVLSYLPESKVEDLNEIEKLFNVYVGAGPYGEQPLEERVRFVKEYFKKKFNQELIGVEPPRD